MVEIAFAAHACSATASQGCRHRFNKLVCEGTDMIKRKVRTFGRKYALLTPLQQWDACWSAYRLTMKRLQG